MLMIIGLPSPRSPINAIHLFPQYLRSRFQFMDLSAHFQSSSFYYEKRLHSQLFSFQAAQPILAENSKRVLWSIRSNVDNNPTNNNQGTTRLFRTIQTFQMKINTRIQELRRDLPMKLLFLLIGYYCATAFSTVIGQTGDWDILSSALAMFIVEGIGALMYRITLPSFSRLRRMLALLNFWKAGLTLGLFMDSFKSSAVFLSELIIVLVSICSFNQNGMAHEKRSEPYHVFPPVLVVSSSSRFLLMRQVLMQNFTKAFLSLMMASIKYIMFIYLYGKSMMLKYPQNMFRGL